MLKRTISGACYVAILVGFFLLRQFVDYRLFQLLTYFFSIVGTFEIARAYKERVLSATKILSTVFSVLFVPVYCVGEYVIKSGIGVYFALCFLLVLLIVNCIMGIISGAKTKTVFTTFLVYCYPSLFLLAMLMANDLGANAFIALLLSFVISPCSDTFAYLVGMLIGGPKLCPKISPKKTWAGAIGGTVGGIVGAILVYFIFTPTVNFFSPVLLFGLIGLVCSIVNIFGDLFESLLKRRVDIKDFGKIMPGHGGVLDRIDGTLFVVVIIYVVFALV